MLDNSPFEPTFIDSVDESHAELRAASCAVYQLLALLKPPALDNFKCSLQAVYANWFFTKRKGLKHPVQTDTIVLFIDSENGERKPLRRRHMGHVIAIEPLLDSIAALRPRIIRNEINHVSFRKIKEWMTYCHQNHLELCKSDKLPAPPDFKVIRCCDSEVVNAPPGCKYAALSYVWGDIECPDPNDHTKFPQVVLDSIKVASELGCDYLWVDRHVG
jgi:hypothetical protein